MSAAIASAQKRFVVLSSDRDHFHQKNRPLRPVVVNTNSVFTDSKCGHPLSAPRPLLEVASEVMPSGLTAKHLPDSKADFSAQNLWGRAGPRESGRMSSVRRIHFGTSRGHHSSLIFFAVKKFSCVVVFQRNLLLLLGTIIY
jgi:hypothetical protein